MLIEMPDGPAMGELGRGAQRRVLVCDDDRHVVRLIEVCLQRHGHEVVKAYNGADALIRAMNQSFDLVLLDVMMPVLDGFEVLRALRTNPDTTYLPVVILTAKSSDRDVFTGYQSGADLYFTKPFSPDELLHLPFLR